MALKPDRGPIEYDGTLTLSDVADAGKVVMHKSGSSGSGVAIGDSAGACNLAADPSGLDVAGLLLTDFVTIDTTQFHKNFHNDEAVTGDKATLGVKGWWTTNCVIGTPAVGDIAYVVGTGFVAPNPSATGGTKATPPVGKFKSIKDADGYVKLALNLPINIKTI